jgi:ribosomal protein S27E
MRIMPHAAAARMATRDRDAGRYQRHRPEQTLLYQIVEQHYPAFTAHLAERGRELPGYVQREFEDYLKCGRLEHGFLRVRCESCHVEHLVAFSCKRRGFCPSCGARRMAESAALLVDAEEMKEMGSSLLYNINSFLILFRCHAQSGLNTKTLFTT